MRALPITGEYPADWKEISDRVWAGAGHRCIRCGHPYRKGEHGKGEWTPCDDKCHHDGPIQTVDSEGLFHLSANVWAHGYGAPGTRYAAWRIGTVHHFDGNKANVAWWNLLALCQRCHLKTQARVDPQVPYMFEHSNWLKPYVAGFYAKKYEGRDITRDEALQKMDKLLSLERIA